MSIGHTAVAVPATEIASGTAFGLLVALAAASRGPGTELADELAGALAEVGDVEGETWLNLLGIPLDTGAPFSVERLVEAVESMNPVELRRHLLGRYAWSWCTLAGVDDIDSAARGDTAAAARLLAHPRYYGGHAQASLGVLLTLDPAETRRRLAAAIAAGAQTLPAAASAAADIEVAHETAAATLEARPPLAAIEHLAGGYRYVPEPEADRVVLVPHLEPALPLVLAQHRSSRLIVYLSTPDRSGEERLLAFGRALADPRRVEILALVGRGVGRAADLVDATGLTRSTVHHHLAQLRQARLVALEGNARAYTYVARPGAAEDAAALVADVIGTEEG